MLKQIELWGCSFGSSRRLQRIWKGLLQLITCTSQICTDNKVGVHRPLWQPVSRGSTYPVTWIGLVTVDLGRTGICWVLVGAKAFVLGASGEAVWGAYASELFATATCRKLRISRLFIQSCCAFRELKGCPSRPYQDVANFCFWSDRKDPSCTW